MAKIKITESELKQVIRESVSEVLTEAFDDRMARQAQRRNNRAQSAWNNYQSIYNDANATDTQKEKARKKYYRTSLRNGVGNLQRAQDAEGRVTKLNQDVENLQAANTQLTQERDNLQTQVTQRDNKINALNGTVAQLTKDKQALGAQLAQARNQTVRSNAPQPSVNQNQAIPAAKPIPQQTARPAAQTPGTAIAQK